MGINNPQTNPPYPEINRILIAGTGALACLFAARLAGAGVEVTMLGSWPEGLAALHEYGVRLVSPSGEEERFPVRATADPEDSAPQRFALVLVKSWQTQRTAGQLSRCLAPDGIALTLQNGLGNRETLACTLGERRVALGTTTSGATLVGPGRVRPGGEGEIHVEDLERLLPLIGFLSSAGFSVTRWPDVESLVWGKLVINAAINPLTALLRLPNGELLERPEARELMAAIALETAGVAAAKGIVLPFEDPVAAAESVAQRTASNTSSMLQDVLRGAPTEVDAICGGVVAAAQELGLEAPINRTLWWLTKAVVNSSRLRPSEIPRVHSE